MKQSADFPMLLQSFFTQRLMAQRRASPHTIASYRDTFRLLLQFAKKELGKPPSQITLDDLNATFIGAFLDNLERDRRNGVRSRNLRMTVIRSFFSDTPRWTHHSTPGSYNESWPFLVSVKNGDWLDSSRAPKSRHCYQSRTETVGWDGGTMHCC